MEKVGVHYALSCCCFCLFFYLKNKDGEQKGFVFVCFFLGKEWNRFFQTGNMCQKWNEYGTKKIQTELDHEVTHGSP